MTDSKKSEMQIRDKAILHQQRRLKQATQFTHKDSAGLLPLDGLKQLGTSKDLQPHSIVQRRLLEGNITRLRGEGRDFGSQVRSPLVEEKGDQKEEIYKPRKSLIVHCTCCDKEVKATINTGYHQNIVSQSCFRQLGLTDMQEVSSDEESGHSFPFGSTLMGRVEKLELLVGQEKVECSALVVEDETFELCLGLQTLHNLKCCIDLDKGVLKLRESSEELPFLESPLNQVEPPTFLP
ncbi:nuclear receptor-interacting protein 2 isoform X2 [Polyodon spathula]|uniref:nuclear receptor-interacting protein 2 isoform X2 n=1 Tax=Polyodon spathula TaxID=7913 RepID=UPI001B7EDD4C|nr:nuclear receptor-interacting protein 2 isoform X2 [Polyodon spathula]